MEVALGILRELRSALEEVVVDEPEEGLFERTAPADEPDLPTPAAAPSPAPPPPASPAPAPPPPPAPDKAKVLDDEPVLVAEFGEEGAEEPAGAQVSVAEPWEGYDGMNVRTLRDRLAVADSELLAAVVLYEGFSKKRRSVIEAAERRLTQLSPPRS